MSVWGAWVVVRWWCWGVAHWLSNLLKEWLNWSGGRDTAEQNGALLSGFRKSVCLRAALMLVPAEDDTV